MKILSAEFVLSAKEQRHYPPDGVPEVAFAGRSNVGKSSLINALLNRKRLARTSVTPGRTQDINFFRVNDKFYLVDLPGYGYARVPEAVRKQWRPMVETYLQERKSLRLVVVILDVRRDPSDEDIQLMGWLVFYAINYMVVLTKADKLSSNELAVRKRIIGDILKSSLNPAVFTFSAKTRAGKEAILREIEKFLG